MKRAGILGLAIVLTLGLTAGTTHAAKAKRVATEVDIDGFRFTPFTFFGNAYSKKPKCVRDRSVTVFRTEGGAHDLAGTATTDETGDWQLSPDVVGSGDYEVEVAKKKIKKHGKRLVCKADVSTYVLPPP
jgi:hypothetical protein